MNYLTAKETRVERAWNKRGLAGLRSELLLRAGEQQTPRALEDESFVRNVAWLVYGMMPVREWDEAVRYVKETCGLAGIEWQDEWDEKIVALARFAEEELREEVGDE